MNYSDYRISKLRLYLFGVINEIISNADYQINANNLSNNVDDYSLDKIPTDSEIESWIIGTVKKRDVFSFRNRKAYSQDTINNLKNIGFFEEFEKKIKLKNDAGLLPDIDNVESIECLNSGTLNNADGHTAEFDIQIQVTYRD